MTTCPTPIIMIDLLRKMRCSPTVSNCQFRPAQPFFERAAEPPRPSPVSDAGQEGGHKEEPLLRFVPFPRCDTATVPRAVAGGRLAARL